MGSNHHTPYSTATLFKYTHLNVPLAELDEAITGTKTPLVTCSGSITFSTAGVLAWDAPIRIFAASTADGKMYVNTIASGSVALEKGDVLYADLVSSLSTATISTAGFSTASTALIPKNRVLLGMVDTTVLNFHGNKLQPSWRTITGSDALKGRQSSVTCATTFAVDFSQYESPFVQLTTNSSCIISNGDDGKVYRLRVQQDATGSWTLAIGATAGSIKWRGGSAPTISTGATHSDIITFLRSNGTWFADITTGF